MALSAKDFMAKLQKAHGICHLLYIFSPDNKEKNSASLYDLLDDFSTNKIKVAIHLFLKDNVSFPKASFPYILELEKHLKDKYPFISIATVSGEYYDRQNNRIFPAVIKGEAPRFSSAENALLSSYKNNVFDNFMAPVTIADYQGVHNNDGMYFIGFTPESSFALMDILKVHKDSSLIFTSDAKGN